MKRVFLLILIFGTLFTLTACHDESKMMNNRDKSENSITIRVAWWGTQPRHEYTTKIIEMYEKENPNINIESEFDDWDNYWKKLEPMAAANQLPDVIQMDIAFLSQYGEIGLLEDLTPYIEKSIIDISSIDKNILNSGKIADELYGFTMGINVLSVITNDHLLEQAEIEIDDSDWTWEDMEKVALDIKRKTGIYGSNGMNPPDIFFPYYLRTKGKDLYNENGTGLAYKDDKLFIDYFNLQLRLVDEGAFPTPNAGVSKRGIEEEYIVNGTSAITWNYSNQYTVFDQLTDSSLSLHLPPDNSKKNTMLLKPSMMLSIPKTSKVKDEAAKFINFLVNNIEANKVMKGERGIPVSQIIMEAIKPDLSKGELEILNYVKAAKKLTTHYYKPDPIGSTEVMKELKDISDQILLKKITPKEGAKIFRMKAENILKANKK